MGNHARLSPSGSVLWVNCPGSLKHRGEVKFNYAMAQGTLAHALAQDLLDPPQGDGARKWPRSEAHPWYTVRNDGFVNHTEAPAEYKPDDDALKDEFFVRYDDEMQEYVKAYVEYVCEMGADAEKIHVELRVDISGVTGAEGDMGTLDAGFYDPKVNTCHIIDLKYGYKEVGAEGNTALIMYAWAFFDTISNQLGTAPDFMLHIYQPRINNLSTAIYSLPEITDLVVKIKEAAKRVDATPDALQAGDHCYQGYCPAMATCTEARALVYRSVAEDLPDVDLETLSSRLKAVPFLKAWAGSVVSDADETAIGKGLKIPDFKVVEGNAGNRQWIDAETVDALLAKAKIRVSDRRTYTVISPTQTEKLYKKGGIPASRWEDLQEYITRKEAGYKVVPESDKRKPVDITPPVDLLPDDDFCDLI